MKSSSASLVLSLWLHWRSLQWFYNFSSQPFAKSSSLFSSPPSSQQQQKQHHEHDWWFVHYFIFSSLTISEAASYHNIHIKHQSSYIEHKCQQEGIMKSSSASLVLSLSLHWRSLQWFYNFSSQPFAKSSSQFSSPPSSQQQQKHQHDHDW
jgi:hypothetical protein